MTEPENTPHQDRYLARLLEFPSGLQAGGASSGREVVASYWRSDGYRPFAFCRDGLLVAPDGDARFIAFTDIEDCGLRDREPLRNAKKLVDADQPLEEGLALTLVSGERIALPLLPRMDGFSERLLIAGLIDRYARRSRAD